MQMAREDLDVALFTAWPEMALGFWRDRLGLPETGTMVLPEGRTQHRLGLGGGLLKINAAPAGLPQAAAAGLVGIRVALAGQDHVQPLHDPQGNELLLVPPGDLGVVVAGLDYAVADPDALLAFVAAIGGHGATPDAISLGSTRIFASHDPAATASPLLVGNGWRYVTVQVTGCDSAFAAALAAGATAELPPQPYGDIARFAMVRDPCGQIWEFSQNRALTGSIAPR
jgi:catechol 2,3-dioxygenase-like lactoylglutathione lyase family enzyme